jgi:thiol:disulfide interchange protein DsbG
VNSRHLLCALALALPLGAFAQTIPPVAAPPAVAPSVNPRPIRSNGDTMPALAVPLQHGFHIVKSFAAASGLTGWVLKDANGKYTILYTTADGQTLITGALFNSSGENLSQLYTDLHVPSADLTGTWSDLEQSSFVVSGVKDKPKSVIYVIMDPNCIYCHLLSIALKPYEAAGLQVRWVPVGFLKVDSPTKAAALLTRGDEALQELQDKFDERTESGGIAGIVISADMKTRLDDNMKIMHAVNLTGTPGIFYKDAAGHVRMNHGVPTLSELPSVTGLPLQPEPDARVQRFN